MGQEPTAATGARLPRGFFPAVEPDAAVQPLLQRLGAEVQVEMEAAEGVDATVHTELRAGRGAAGDVTFLRFYWSGQHADRDSPWGFAARTIHCDRRDPAPRVHVFPAEPALTMLADSNGPLLDEGRPRHVEVLRYIPLRRVTFRLHDAPGLPPSVIAKVKRPGGLDRALAAFRAVQDTVDRQGSRALRVPRILGHESRRGVLYLEELPGESLDAALHRLDLAAAMEQLGASHRDLQELDIDGDLPRKLTADWVQDARHAATQIGLFRPSEAHRAEVVNDRLVRTAPDDGGLRYCQGDFLPGQILCDPGGWSIIDLDDSRYADPLSDAAALYSALPREHGIPADRVEEARQAYLDAYARRAGERLDADRWRWFLTLAQLTDLAKRLVKGRATADEATAVLDRLTTLRVSDGA
jgi:aminoglycoside phosphotransferase